MDYEDMDLDSLIESQRVDDAIGEKQYPEFPGRLMVSVYMDDIDPTRPYHLTNWATTDTSIQTYALKQHEDLRFGTKYEIDGAYQTYLRAKRRPTRIAAYAEDLNGVASKNRERNREYLKAVRQDPERHDAYLAKRREQAARRRGKP